MGDRADGATAPIPSRARFDALACALLFAIAFLIRVVGTHMFGGLGAPPNAEAFYDGVEFELMARHLVERGVLAIWDTTPTSFRAPGLPLVLAGVYSVFGPGNFVAAHLALCAIGALLVWPTYRLGLMVGGRAVAVLAGALVAVTPNVAYYAIHFASEPLHSVLLTSAVLTLARGARERRPACVLLAGLLLGASGLARPLSIYFLPFFALALRAWVPTGTAARWTALLAAGVAMAVLPWSARNYIVHDRWLLVASNGGSTFWGSNNDVVAGDPVLRGEWISTLILRGDHSPIDSLPNEVDRDQAEFERGKQWVRQNPSAAVRLAGWKLVKLFTPFPTSSNRTYVLGTAAGYLLLVPFVIPGLVVLLRGGREVRSILAILAAPVAGTVLAAVVFYGSNRFRAPIEPLLIIVAAAGMWALVRRWLPATHGTRADAL